MVSLTRGISQYQRKKKTFNLNTLITRTDDKNMKETKL